MSINTMDSFSCRVPATSANLGPGFDILGLALKDPFLEMTVSLSSSPSFISDCKPYDFVASPLSRVFSAMSSDFDLGKKFPVVSVTSSIPIAKGMGSSGALSAGMAFCISNLFGLDLSPDQLVHYASQGEASCHMDNVAPAIFGGITAVLSYDPSRVWKVSRTLSAELMVFVPDIEKGSTAHARSLIPDSYPRSVSVESSRRMAGVISCLLSNSVDDLSLFLHDELVEPYREKAGIIPLLSQIRKLSKSHGCAACASGAGPSVLVIGKSIPADLVEGIKSIYSYNSIKLLNVFSTTVDPKGVRSL